MAEFFIETTIDKLIALLRKRKRISISEAAKILKVKQKKIDEWVFTLEDRGIVDLKYPILGEPEIVLKKVESEKISYGNRSRIKLETRIIPGKPIKKRHLPKFKSNRISLVDEEPREAPKTQEMSDSDYNSIIDELRSLQDRISKMATRKSIQAEPSNKYVNEKLKFLEEKLVELSKKNKKEEKLYDTERAILKKIEKIEERLPKKRKKKKR